MKTNFTNRPLLWLLAVVINLFNLTATAQSVDTWSGNSATPTPNWSDTGNWDTLPVSGDYVIFSGTTQTASFNDIDSLSLGWLWLNNSGYVLTGKPITLMGGLTNSFDGNTVGFNLTLGTAEFISSQSGTLTLGPGVGLAATITNNGNALTFTDGGDFLLQGAITGAGSLIMAGSGNLTVTNRQPLTGGIFVNAGTVTFNTTGNLNFGGAETPSLITINTNGTVLGNATHAIGGGTAVFVNRGDWKLNYEDYKQNLTMWDGLIEPGPSPNASGGELRVGSSGGNGSWTWFVTNSLVGSVINSPVNTIGPGVTLTLDVARGAASSDLTISGPIRNGGNIIFARNGITTLSGSSTHTGTITINGGAVQLTGSLLSSAITVGSGAVFDVSGTSYTPAANQILAGVGTVIGSVNDYDLGAIGSAISPGGGAVGTLTMDGLNLSGNTLALNFNLSAVTTVGGGVNDLITCTNLTLSGGAANTVNFTFSGNPAAGAYTLITYPLGQGPAAGPVTALAAAASRSTYTFSSTGTSIQVTVVANPAPLVWRGDGATNNWDLNTSSNWINGVVKDVFLTGDNVTFNDTGSNTPPVNLVGALSANLVTVNATKDYTFSGSGKISGSSKLLKSNSGNLTILTANDNTGGGGLNGSGTVTVGSGGTTVANIGTGTLTNNTKVTFFENTGVTYAGNMIGTGSLVSFMPAATLTLTGTNSFTGGLIAANGTTQIGNNTAGSSVIGTITNYSTLNLYRSDAFTNLNNITSAGNTLEYGNGDINVRGVAGMTVDGSGSINTLPQGALSVGQGAYGKLTINPGAVITLGSGLFVGNPNSAGGGDVIMNGGTVTANGNSTRIGHWATEISTFTMNGGTFNAPNNQLGVGWDGIGLMFMNGGTVNVRTLNIDDNGATAAISGTNSTLIMTNGTINIGTGGIGGNTANIILGGGTIGTLVPPTLVAAGWSSAMNMTLTNNGPTFDSSNSSITLSGILSGKGGLTKQGVGYLNLNGVNTYTNVTTIAAGTLQGSGTVVGPVTVNSGANLSAGAALATGTLTTSNVTVNAGGNLVFDLNSASSASDLLYVRGLLTLNSTPVTLNFIGGGTPLTNVSYTIISNLVARSGSLVYNNPTRYAATLDQSQANRVQVSFSGANAALVWQGGVSTNWNVNTDANWLNAGVTDTYYQSDAVIFDNTGITKSNVNLTAAMTPASITVNSAGNYAFTGSPITGVTPLTKNGSGKLTLLNSNAYTGITTIAAGTLQVGNGGILGSLPVGGTVGDYSSLVFNRSDTNSFNGVINGPGQLTQAGSGTLLITATQNHYGGTTVNAGGTIQLGNGALADSGSLGNGTVTNNGTVNFYRLSSIAVATPYTGGGNFNFLGTGGNAQSAYSLNATNTFTGPVTLTLARLQSGAGAQSFGSPSSLTVNPGSQVYAVATPASSVYNIPLTLYGTGWQDGLGALRIENGGTWAGPITLASNARIGVNNATTNTITGTIAGNYELETYGGNATAALVLTPSSANSYKALRVSIGTAGSKTIAGNNNAIPNNIPLTMNGGTLWLNGFSKSFSPFLNLSGSSSIQNGSASAAATVTLAPVLGSSTYNGTFADGSTQPLNVTFTQTPGLWTLALPTASPNWTGNLTNNGGTISSGTQNTPFGSQGVVGRSIVGNNGATFVMTLNNVLNGYSGNMVLNNSTWLCTRFVGFSPAAGSLVLANSTINGTNNTDGSGFLSMRLPSTVKVGGTSPSYMLGSGSGAGYGLASSGATTFDVANATGNANVDLLVTPLIYGSSGLSLVKTGLGTMEMDGNNIYSGPTVINGGTLTLGAAATVLSSSITIAGGATLDVSALPGGLTLLAGQTLAGSGTVNGSVSDALGTVIQPGSSAGTLTITTNLTLGGLGILNFDLANTTTVGGGVNDLIRVNHDLDISSGTPMLVNFNFLNGAPATGVAYTLIQCNGTITGTASTAFTNSSRYNPVFSQTANAVQVTFSGSASNLVWQGDGSGDAWDIATSPDWFDGAAANTFYQNDTVKFDDTSVNTTVNLNVTVTPAAITVDSTNNYFITGSGTIAGNTGLTKNNTNALTLGTPNTFSGPVMVNAGVIALGNNSALPQNANVAVANGAQFDFAGQGNSTTRNYSFTIGGNGPDGSGALVNSGASISGNASVTSLTLTTNTTIGQVGGTGRWDMGSGQSGTVLNGNGYNLTLKNSNSGLSMRPQLLTNVASITLSSGRMWYEGFPQTNSWTATTTNYILPGTILGDYAAQPVNVPIVLTNAMIENEGGGGTPVWLGGITLQGTNVFNNSAAQAFSGVVSGPGGIWVDGGTAALTFSNANSYAGGTVISNAPTTTTAANASAGTAAVILGTGSALGSGTLTINGLNYPALATNSAWFATNVLRAVEFNLTAPGTMANNIVFPAATITNVGLQCRNSAQVVNLTGQISGGFTGLTNWIDVADASGGGVVRYANNGNNFFGNSTVFRGTLAITGDGSLGNSANVLRLATGSQGNGLRFDAPNVNVAHTINITSSSGLNVYGDNNGDGTPDTANDATISGSIVSTATGSIVLATGGTNIAGTSFGTLTLSGSNSFNHQLTIDVNTKVIAANSNALGQTGFVLLVNPGGTIALANGGGFVNRQLNLQGAGVLSGGAGVGALENLNGNNIYTGSLSLQGATSIGVTAGSLAVNSVISGAFPVTKVGLGVLTLGGANTYSAGTIVNAGSLLVNGSLPAGNLVSVGSGAALGGSGVINGPVVTLPGAVLQPGGGGATVGKLTVNSTLNLNGNTVMFLNKTTPTNSQVAGISTVVYGGTLSVTNLSGTLTMGDTFKLFSAQDYSGNFSTVTLPILDANLSWSNSLALNGSIQVITNSSSVNPNPTNLDFSAAGNQLTLSWPADHTGWRLLVQTNHLQAGVSSSTNDWDTVNGSAATNQVIITLDPLKPTEFYRLVYP